MPDQRPPSQGSQGSNDSNRSNWMRSLGYFSIIIGDIIGFTGAGVGIGYYAWKHWNAPWWVVLLTSMTGLSISMYRLYKMTQREFD